MVSLRNLIGIDIDQKMPKICVPLSRRQIIIIDSAFPIKSGPNICMLLKQTEKADSEQGFRFHDFNFFFFRG